MMNIIHLPTVPILVATTRCQYQGGGVYVLNLTSLNSFPVMANICQEQGDTPSHLMSTGMAYPLTSDVHGRKGRGMGYSLKSDVQWRRGGVSPQVSGLIFRGAGTPSPCDLSHNACDVTPPPPPNNNVCKYDDIGNFTDGIYNLDSLEMK